MDINFVKFFMPRLLKDRPEWKTSWDAPDDQAGLVKELATAVVSYADALKEDKGWQKPNPNKKATPKKKS